MVPKAYLWNCKNVKLTLAIALQTKHTSLQKKTQTPVVNYEQKCDGVVR